MTNIRTPAKARLDAAKQVLRWAWEHGTDEQLERAHERYVDAGVDEMVAEREAEK